jgi:hypothetical protein
MIANTHDPSTIPMVTTTLSIGGHNFDPREVTAITGVAPTRIWTPKNQAVVAAIPTINSIEWIIEFEKQQHGSLGDAIDEVLDVLRNKKEDTASLLTNKCLEMHINCRPFGDATTIVYEFGPETIKRLAYFGASISMAVYKSELCSVSDQDRPATAERPRQGS